MQFCDKRKTHNDGRRFDCGLAAWHDGECRRIARQRRRQVLGNLSGGVFEHCGVYTVERLSTGGMNVEILHSGDSREAAVSYFRRWVR